MKMTMQEVVGHLTMTSMKVNYAEFVKNRTKDEADKGMLCVFGKEWEKARKQVTFWHENEFVRDENGEVKMAQQIVTLADFRLSNYRYEDDPEYDGDGVIENSKRWHIMDDHNGKRLYLDVSPYATMTKDDTKKFSEIAIRLGRLPTRKDNDGVNFDSESIAALLTKLEDEHSYHRDMAEMDQQNHQWDEADVEAYQERWK